MDQIANKTKAAISPLGITFYNNRHNSCLVSGSSKFDYYSASPSEKTPNPPKPKKWTKPRTKPEGYCVNKSLVKSKAHVFFELPTSRKFIAFYSISFPEGLPDKIGMKCLNIWLTRIRKLNPKINYLWVAERQKNGTMHFHVLVDKWLNIRVTNWYMAQSLDKYRNDLPEVFKNWNKRKYNGVDVREVYNRKGVQKYIAKYCTKRSDLFECRANGFSRLISGLFTKVMVSSSTAWEYWCYFSRIDDCDPSVKE